MTEAKQKKLQEYGTEILTHDPTISRDNSRVRFNNTFKSSILEQDPKPQDSYHNRSRDRLYTNRPLSSQVQRTSYQDSNIFGYKDETNITV